MPFYKKIKQNNTLRLFFFGIGIIAVAAITGMNVYSLYALRESTIEAAKDLKKNQLEEFTYQVRYRFTRLPIAISKFDMELVDENWDNRGTFPEELLDVLVETAQDSLFTEIHYLPGEAGNCHNPEFPIYKFDPYTSRFNQTSDIPDTVCDGFGISISQVKALLGDIRFSTKLTFDAHRSMTLALINFEERIVVGHLSFIINRDYLTNSILKPKLLRQFGPGEESGMVVWLRDWMQNDILFGNDDNHTFSRDVIDIRQRFPGLLDNWILEASFIESPTVTASNASFTRNLIVLGVAVFVLFGALVFMFINAQRERELAQRQAGFLANITHELKTPLAVMQAAGENISDGRVTDGQRLKSYGDHIYQESVRLRKMIEKLLDVAKVDSGQTLVEQAPHHIENLVAKYYQANKQYVEKKGFQFRFKHEDNLPLVMIDPDHLETILSNLVENSLKYSFNKKEISLTVREIDDQVEILVSDKGDGIPKKSHKLIFEKFYRAENTLTAKTKGHGLGLAIVKNLTEMNGGSIHVESEEGEGAVFTVRFPALMKSTRHVPVEQAAQNGKPLPKHLEIDEYIR